MGCEGASARRVPQRCRSFMTSSSGYGHAAAAEAGGSVGLDGRVFRAAHGMLGGRRRRALLASPTFPGRAWRRSSRTPGRRSCPRPPSEAGPPQPLPVSAVGDGRGTGGRGWPGSVGGTSGGDGAVAGASEGTAVPCVCTAVAPDHAWTAVVSGEWAMARAPGIDSSARPSTAAVVAAATSVADPPGAHASAAAGRVAGAGSTGGTGVQVPARRGCCGQERVARRAHRRKRYIGGGCVRRDAASACRAVQGRARGGLRGRRERRNRRDDGRVGSGGGRRRRRCRDGRRGDGGGLGRGRARSSSPGPGPGRPRAVGGLRVRPASQGSSWSRERRPAHRRSVRSRSRSAGSTAGGLRPAGLGFAVSTCVVSTCAESSVPSSGASSARAEAANTASTSQLPSARRHPATSRASRRRDGPRPAAPIGAPRLRRTRWPRLELLPRSRGHSTHPGDIEARPVGRQPIASRSRTCSAWK